jgi:hypothetical protein
MDSLVSGPAAFRLKAYPGAVYETLVEKGRPILQGPMSANHLITEVGVGIPFSLSLVAAWTLFQCWVFCICSGRECAYRSVYRERACNFLFIFYFIMKIHSFIDLFIFIYLFY